MKKNSRQEVLKIMNNLPTGWYEEEWCGRPSNSKYLEELNKVKSIIGIPKKFDYVGCDEVETLLISRRQKVLMTKIILYIANGVEDNIISIYHELHDFIVDGYYEQLSYIEVDFLEMIISSIELKLEYRER